MSANHSLAFAPPVTTSAPANGQPDRPQDSATTPPHALLANEVALLLGVPPAVGLSSSEARSRLAQFGPNEITPRRGIPPWLRLLKQFHQPVVYLLVVAAVITITLGEWVDSAVILGVVVVNAIVGFIQETRAEKAIEALSQLVPVEATVRRDGSTARILARDLVRGDIVRLEAGDRVPADMRLISVRGLQADESALTGESAPVMKTVGVLPVTTLLPERSNLAFGGTLVVAGYGEGIVTATGDQTETGKIADLLAGVVEVSTPLMRKITQFSRISVWVVLVLASVTFLVGLARGENPVEMFMAAVAVAVGAIPEGLPAAVTIVLAIGVTRMSRRCAIIRRLPAVETLGSTTVICSDKTGTLTENQMVVRAIFVGDRQYELTGSGYATRGEIRIGTQPVQHAEHPALAECLRAGMLCNDAEVTHDGDRHIVQGDPTEAALLVAAAKAGLIRAEALEAAPRIDAIPFASEHMFRATLHTPRDGPITLYAVGAVETLLERCSATLTKDGGIAPLNMLEIRAAVESMAAAGLRVIGLARRFVSFEPTELKPEHVADLTFLGLQAMIDPPRAEAITAVYRCQKAGIAVKMITGDHVSTARAIAAQVGLRTTRSDDPPVALSGRDLENISDAALPEVVHRTTVFARVAPAQKLRLVRALQARGDIVAMTGDGVNDAPALKQADIGIAMGRTGTATAKGAAAMILTDDNFASIEAAIEEGRGVFDNLTKYLVWTLPTNLGESLILFTAILAGVTLPALPLHLLWINMTTALFLGMSLVFEPKEPGLMDQPPRDPRQPLLTRTLLLRTALVSAVILIGAYWVFHHEFVAARMSLEASRTAVVNVIVFVEIAFLFNSRSLNCAAWHHGFFSNPWALAGAAVMIVAQLLFTYAPVMNGLFHTAPVSGAAWVRILAVAAAAFLLVEIEKAIRRRLNPSGCHETAR